MKSAISFITSARSRSRRDYGTAVIREWMRRSFLKCTPDRIADCFFLAPKVRTPKAQHFHSTRGQPGVAQCASLCNVRMSVLKPIDFDIERCFETKEVEDVGAGRMLAPKLVGGKSSVAQPGPHEAFAPRVPFAQIARESCQLWILLMHLGPDTALQNVRQFSLSQRERAGVRESRRKIPKLRTSPTRSASP